MSQPSGAKRILSLVAILAISRPLGQQRIDDQRSFGQRQCVRVLELAKPQRRARLLLDWWRRLWSRGRRVLRHRGVVVAQRLQAWTTLGGRSDRIALRSELAAVLESRTGLPAAKCGAVSRALVVKALNRFEVGVPAPRLFPGSVRGFFSRVDPLRALDLSACPRLSGANSRGKISSRCSSLMVI
jgi:hypothetical protein